MRIIAGEFRGRVLKSPPDLKTRPTSDRLRESLFNIIAPRIDEGTRFLDLCAGTGAIGIEAISRGAEFVSFIDKSKRACALIEENLEILAIPDENTELLNLEAETFTGREHAKTWDIAYYDPPYDSDYSLVMHEFGSNGTLLAIDGLLIVEHHSKKKLPDLTGSIRRWRIVKQGDSSLSFYERN